MITASVVTFHTRHDELQRLIDCVMQSPVECLYVVDNSSNDELRGFVGENPRIKYIHSQNRGYGAGHNIAIRLAMDSAADYHVVLNPDVYWTGDVIESLCRFMDEHPACGLVMPQVLYPSGCVQHLCKLLPTPMDLFGRRFVPIRSYQRKHDYRYELQWTGYDRTMEVPALSGCFMFMRCDALKQVGSFDERFFMYAEDLDLCRRIGEVSETLFYPLVSVTHEYEKGSYKNRRLLRYHIVSVVKYFNKWGWFFDKKRRMRNRFCLKKMVE